MSESAVKANRVVFQTHPANSWQIKDRNGDLSSRIEDGQLFRAKKIRLPTQSPNHYVYRIELTPIEVIEGSMEFKT